MGPDSHTLHSYLCQHLADGSSRLPSSLGMKMKGRDILQVPSSHLRTSSCPTLSALHYFSNFLSSVSPSLDQLAQQSYLHSVATQTYPIGICISPRIQASAKTSLAPRLWLLCILDVFLFSFSSHFTLLLPHPAPLLPSGHPLSSSCDPQSKPVSFLLVSLSGPLPKGENGNIW